MPSVRLEPESPDCNSGDASVKRFRSLIPKPPKNFNSDGCDIMAYVRLEPEPTDLQSDDSLGKKFR